MSFPLYLDEHVPSELALRLSRIGVDVLTTAAAGRAGVGNSDESQLGFAAGEGRAILTYDGTDYALIARDWFLADRTHSGIIVSRNWPLKEIHERLLLLFEQYPHGIADLYLRLP